MKRDEAIKMLAALAWGVEHGVFQFDSPPVDLDRLAAGDRVTLTINFDVLRDYPSARRDVLSRLLEEYQ